MWDYEEKYSALEMEKYLSHWRSLGLWQSWTKVAVEAIAMMAVEDHRVKGNSRVVVFWVAVILIDFPSYVSSNICPYIGKRYFEKDTFLQKIIHPSISKFLM